MTHRSQLFFLPLSATQDSSYFSYGDLNTYIIVLATVDFSSFHLKHHRARHISSRKARQPDEMCWKMLWKFVTKSPRTRRHFTPANCRSRKISRYLGVVFASSNGDSRTECEALNILTCVWGKYSQKRHGWYECRRVQATGRHSGKASRAGFGAFGG